MAICGYESDQQGLAYRSAQDSIDLLDPFADSLWSPGTDLSAGAGRELLKRGLKFWDRSRFDPSFCPDPKEPPIQLCLAVTVPVALLQRVAPRSIGGAFTRRGDKAKVDSRLQ